MTETQNRIHRRDGKNLPGAPSALRISFTLIRSPENLEVEIAESVLITNTDEIIINLNSIRVLGVQAIDDFGTFYSSLNYLKTLPLKRIKIAKEFVDGIGKNAAAVAIISAVVVMARSMNLEIIAEGVETKEQLDFLIAHSCYIIQGYYFSKPIPDPDAREQSADLLLRSHNNEETHQ